MLNHVSLVGRLTANPELRYTTTNKPVAAFRLAIKRDFGDDTDFINCTAWGKTAEFLDQYFRKGMMLILVGRLQSRDWTDKDGKKRYSVEAVADRVWFGEPKKPEQDGVQDEGAFDDVPDGYLPF